MDGNGVPLDTGILKECDYRTYTSFNVVTPIYNFLQWNLGEINSILTLPLRRKLSIKSLNNRVYVRVVLSELVNSTMTFKMLQY